MHPRLIATSVIAHRHRDSLRQELNSGASSPGLPHHERERLDGSGSPARRASVRVEGDRIAAVGDVTARSGETTIDAHGLTLAPGFIDTHSHADDDLFDHPDALAVVSQGITTIIGGQDGGSPSRSPLLRIASRNRRRHQRRHVRRPRQHPRLRDG